MNQFDREDILFVLATEMGLVVMGDPSDDSEQPLHLPKGAEQTLPPEKSFSQLT